MKEIFKFKFKVVGSPPTLAQRVLNETLWNPAFFAPATPQLRGSQWPCFRCRCYSRKLRRCAVLSVRASTRVKTHAVLRLSLDVVLNAASIFLKTNTVTIRVTILNLKKLRPHSKMALNER